MHPLMKIAIARILCAILFRLWHEYKMDIKNGIPPVSKSKTAMID